MKRSLQLLGAVFALSIVGAASAQTWPTKTIRVVVPFTPGSGTDIIARSITDKLAIALGQAIVVDNRAGAGSTIGAAMVAKADPDGYTILVNSSSHTVAPHTYSNLPYDTLRDLTGITPLAALPNVLIIAPSKGIKNVQELVALAKSKPGSLNYASAGQGSATHLNAERFRLAAGFEGTHIPFKGTPEAVTEVIAGRVDVYFCPVVSALSHLKDGKVLALAVGSPKRSSALPDVQTTLEAGFANSDYTFWVGMFVPSKTPKEIMARLYQETNKALALPDVRERLTKLGAEPMPMNAGEFDAFIRKEVGANGPLIKAAGVKGN
ncbi:MAG: tripartite tricarboxylate transporter substrate binding protein [Burkholderiales bacterium]